jgi:hypothetical protein
VCLLWIKTKGSSSSPPQPLLNSDHVVMFYITIGLGLNFFQHSYILEEASQLCVLSKISWWYILDNLNLPFFVIDVASVLSLYLKKIYWVMTDIWLFPSGPIYLISTKYIILKNLMCWQAIRSLDLYDHIVFSKIVTMLPIQFGN